MNAGLEFLLTTRLSQEQILTKCTPGPLLFAISGRGFRGSYVTLLTLVEVLQQAGHDITFELDSGGGLDRVSGATGSALASASMD